MPKKSDNGNPNRGSAGGDHGGNSNRGGNSDPGGKADRGGNPNRGQGSGGSDFSQKGGVDRGQASGANDFSQAFGPNQDQGSGGTDYGLKRQADQLAQGVKKGGCLPKLFMLLVPLMAVGTWFLLSS